MLQDITAEEDLYRLPVKYSKEFLKAPFASASQSVDDNDVQDAIEYDDADDVQDATEYVEDKVLSLQDVERKAIIKALKRHDGVRRFAARDLKISERTLYRKIKEYKLDDL